jgi:16S rRNA (uracil1498-N3)-methyltransferase
VHRFYVPGLGSENHVWLEGDEAQHLAKVLRVAQGDTVALFDGSGVECIGTVERLERRRVMIAIQSRSQVDLDPALDLTVACSIVKSKAMDLLIGKCSELGAREIVPLETARSVPKVAHKEAAHVDRWQRIAIESSKQCGRTTVTRIAAPRPFRRFLDQSERWNLRLLFSLDEDASPLHEALAEHPSPSRVVCAVGPEGGFELAEARDACAAGFVPVRMGKSTLRSETAAAAAAACVLYHYER